MFSYFSSNKSHVHSSKFSKKVKMSRIRRDAFQRGSHIYLSKYYYLVYLTMQRYLSPLLVSSFANCTLL
jgi:hypothetical protein